MAGTVEAVFGDYQMTLGGNPLVPEASGGPLTLPVRKESLLVVIYIHNTTQKSTLKEREWPGNLVALGQYHTYLVVGIQVLGHFSDRQVLFRRLRTICKDNWF